MGLWRQATRGLRVLIRRETADADLACEVEHFLDEAAAARVADGMSPAEARRAVRLELGGATAAREQVRDHGWESTVGTAAADARYAARRLRNAPGFTAVAALTLALGIGSSTAIFSAVRPILFEPLPYPDPDRIVALTDRADDGSPFEIAFGTFREVADRSRSFDALAVMRRWEPVITRPPEPERIDGQRVSAAYFRVLGVKPALGPGFDAADDRLGGPQTVILSDALWRRRFGGDTAIVGAQVSFGDTPYTVVGVMPPTFENVPSPAAEVWTLLQYDASLPIEGREWGHHLRMIGRLRARVTAEAAAREIGRIARAPVPEFARPRWAAMAQGLLVTSLRDDVTRGVRPALLAVTGAVALLLCITCVNVTNLLLARGARRRSEFAMRVALGAGRGRIARQMLTESLALGLLGGALGLGAAAAGVRALVALSPASLPRVEHVRLDPTAFAFALGVTLLVALATGALPALAAGRGDLDATLRRRGRGATAGGSRGRGALVVAEIALALVLLVGAGLLLRSLRGVLAEPPGFDPRQVLAVQVRIAGTRYADDGAANRFYASALDAVRRVPGVADAAFTSQLPLGGDEGTFGVHFESTPTGPSSEGGTFRYAVSPGYLQVMGIPLRRGRALDARDAAGAPLAVLVSESLARSKFQGRDPIGARLRIGANEGPWATVVGVAADVKQSSLALSRPAAVYITDVQQRGFADRARWIVVRARGDAAASAAAVKRAVWSVDASQAIVRVATMKALVDESVAERRFLLTLFECFALAALALAAVGIYGVLAGAVAERAREIGVRSALGATRGRIVGMVMTSGLRLVAVGAAVGVAGAMGGSRVLESLLFGVSPLDPLTYAAVVALLAAAAAAACAVPAWRASRVDPAITLRSE